MAQSATLQFRLMTYNIGGGRKSFANARGDFQKSLEAILELITDIQPDILMLQEATDYQDADGTWVSVLDQIARAGNFGSHYYFGPTLTMREHMHVGKPILVEGVFCDWQDWRQGNAAFCRRGFVRLSDPAKAGLPRNVPIYRPPVYEGNRDTDPRYTLLARMNQGPQFPFVMGVHLTTLVGERGSPVLPEEAQRAQVIRVGQARQLLDLIRRHLLEREELVFLLGDFNAENTEPCMTVLENEGGFVRLAPSGGPHQTHPKASDAVDHILVYPRSRLVDYQCWTVNTELALNASDHLPVVADVIVT